MAGMSASEALLDLYEANTIISGKLLTDDWFRLRVLTGDAFKNRSMAYRNGSS
jgi:hypothetical protein